MEASAHSSDAADFTGKKYFRLSFIFCVFKLDHFHAKEEQEFSVSTKLIRMEKPLKLCSLEPRAKELAAL